MSQQNNQQSRRGRRGGNTRNYADPSRIQQAQSDQDKIQKQLDDNEQRARSAPKPKVDVNKFINEGKAVLNKFFLSFESKDRSNVVVEMDEELPYRICDFYKDRIESEARSSTEYLQDNTLPATDVRKFRAGIDAAIAIKLYHSSPQYEQGMNDQLSFLKPGKALIPEKSSVVINQLGKTDLPNNNKLRLSQQGLLTKRFMVRSIYEHLGVDDFYAECSLAQNNGFTQQHLTTFIRDHFNLMVDESRAGLRTLKELGKEYFLKMSNRNIDVTIQQNALAAGPAIVIPMRLPEFKFKNQNTIADVVQYLQNPIFDQTTFTLPNLQTWIDIVCALTFQCAPLSWLTQPNRNMQVLNQAFANTPIANITFQGLMVASGIWSINAFITDKQLNDLFGEVLHNWSTVDVPRFRNFIKFKEVAFSEYGSEAQLIQVQAKYATADDDFDYRVISEKAIAETALQTSETSAIFGVMAKFTKNVRFTSDFKINYSSTNQNILREFLKSDLV